MFQIQPLADQNVQLTEERWSTDPEQPTRHYGDSYGNPCLRLTIRPAGPC